MKYDSYAPIDPTNGPCLYVLSLNSPPPSFSSFDCAASHRQRKPKTASTEARRTPKWSRVAARVATSPRNKKLLPITASYYARAASQTVSQIKSSSQSIWLFYKCGNMSIIGLSCSVGWTRLWCIDYAKQMSLFICWGQPSAHAESASRGVVPNEGGYMISCCKHMLSCKYYEVLSKFFPTAQNFHVCLEFPNLENFVYFPIFVWDWCCSAFLHTL